MRNQRHSGRNRYGLPACLGLAGALLLPPHRAPAQHVTVSTYGFSSVAVIVPVNPASNPQRLYSLQATAGQTFASPARQTGQANKQTVQSGFFQTGVKFVFRGHVDLDDFLNLPPVTVNTIPCTVRFYSGFDDTIADEVAGFPDANGNFSVFTWANPAPLIGATRYPADMGTKAIHWLRKRMTPTLPSSPLGYPSASFLLLNADVDNDNGVDIEDLGDLADAFNTSPASPDWNANADLNGDNRVDIFDLAILSENFNFLGDP